MTSTDTDYLLIFEKYLIVKKNISKTIYRWIRYYKTDIQLRKTAYILGTISV